MQTIMPASHPVRSQDPHLRCVFSDRVMSFALGAQPTLADITRMLSEPAARRYGKPLAIEVAWPSDVSPRP